MRRLANAALCLLLAAGIHIDWHLARPTHHRLSAGWAQHWIFAAAFFAAVACMVARRGPAERWRTGAGVLLCGILVAQGLIPVLEAAYYEGRLGFTVDAERWRAFWECLAAGVPAYAAALWLCVPRPARSLAA